MTGTSSIKDLKGKWVVNITTGENVAKVADTMIDANGARMAAILIQVGDFLQPEYQYIHSDDVQVWGNDVILVRGGDVLVPETDVAGREQWLKTSDYLRRRTVLDANGTRIGQVNDILIDTQGQFAGYALGQVDIDGPLAESKYIPASTTQSVGPDYVIVDTSRSEPEALTAETPSAQEAAPAARDEEWIEDRTFVFNENSTFVPLDDTTTLRDEEWTAAPDEETTPAGEQDRLPLRDEDAPPLRNKDRLPVYDAPPERDEDDRRWPEETPPAR